MAERYEGRGYGREYGRHYERGPRRRGDFYGDDSGDERDFFDRAGDEVRSWFGDDEAEYRRRRDEAEEPRGYGREGYYRPGYGSGWHEEPRRAYGGSGRGVYEGDDYRGGRRRGFAEPYSERGYSRGDGDYGSGRESRSRREYEGRDYYGGRARRAAGGTARSHIRCRDIMTRDVACATRETTLTEIAKMMRDEDTGVIPVVERAEAAENGEAKSPDTPARSEGDGRDGRLRSNGRLVGLVTDRDIVVRGLAEEHVAVATRAEQVMSDDLHTARPNDRVVEVIRKMGDRQVRRVPVVDGERNLVGIISMADVALETDRDDELAEALEEISRSGSFWG